MAEWYKKMSLFIREMQIKATVRYHLTLGFYQKEGLASVGEDVEKRELLCIISGKGN